MATSSTPSLPPLIEQMLQPDFYPHPVEIPIRLIQTHISYVLLTGEFVYKIKKAVNFGFLDFSSLEQRHHFCQEELRLNRRLAPEIYLDVVSIGQAGDRYGLNLSPPVEYAVKMQQFPQSQLFSHLFEAGELQDQDLIALARQVASFHQQAPSDADIQTYGNLEVIKATHDNNYRISAKFIGRTQTQTQWDQTQTFTQRFFKDHAPWLEERINSHKIKECHGDLHLNNVCRFQGKVQVFDCIEFNREFRNIDVLYDSAFMVMDLEFSGRRDLAFVFLNEYLEQTADYAGVKLLSLYLAMRATIRGNVSSLATEDAAISSQQKAELTQKAIAYYQLAWRYTQRSPGGLFLMCGLSGSGKSTLARALARRKPAIHLRSDAIRKHLAGLDLTRSGNESTQGWEGGIYTPEMTQKTYQTLLQFAIEIALAGWNVILDAKYDRQTLRQGAIAATQQHNLPIQIIHCHAPLDTLRQRITQRQGDISDATVALLEQQLQTMEPFSVTEQDHVLSIDTSTTSTEDSIQAIGIN